MDVTIYSLSDPRTNRIRYVGKTINPAQRLLDHLKERGGYRKCKWIQSMLRSNVSPVMEEIEIIKDSNGKDWQEPERFWIKYLNFLGCDLTNIEDGGENERISYRDRGKKISSSKKGRTAWNKGCKTGKPSWNRGIALTDEVKAKLREKARLRIGPLNGFWGKKHKPETVQHYRDLFTGKSTSQKGVPKTEEHKRKMSAAMKGRIPWNKGLKLK